ncbi:aminodeoxychorismate synthase component I [Raineyella sp. LH-20]|nr:aminodeoxychorismate synthase component I [Raineyella sp. LH-20]WOP19543.1 aminodeoxychorismate synthase component I [Raineyella sp. LH-20]
MTKPEPARRRLDLPYDPLEVLRAALGRDRLVALLGAWHHGEALIAFEPSRVLRDDEDPFADISLPRVTGADDTVGGGWIGVWGYRLGGRLEVLPDTRPRPQPQPEHVLGYYDHVLRFTDGVWWAEGLRGDAALAAYVDDVTAMLAAPGQERTYALGGFEMTPSADDHRAAVARVVEHIEAGDIFQANLCLRLEASFAGDPLDVFCAGVGTLTPAYAAFVSWDGGAIASFSPELFLRRIGDDVLTSPIKGTAPLETDPGDLVASAKDRAENVMIVDLMRNDLGRVCVPGTVRVPAVARAERHAVWHLVSDVVGHLAAGVDDGDLLRATFPPGSVTGAPKVSAMELIDACEASAREAYTGAIGHVSPCAGLELNVVIRTFEFAGGRVWLGVGGGIVADSHPQAEYEECLVKARPLLAAIGGALAVDPPAPARPGAPRIASPAATSLPVDISRPVDIPRTVDRARGVFTTLLVRDGAPVDLEAHIARLDASTRALYGRTIHAGLADAVRRTASGLVGPHRLRIDAVPVPDAAVPDAAVPDAAVPDAAVPAAAELRIRLSSAVLEPAGATWRLTPRIVAGGIGAHKWADRRGFEPDDLILDTDGSVLETGRATIFVVLDDGVHTPPLDGRILPGTARARLVEQLRVAGIPVVQRRLTTGDLAAASEVFAVNALRGVVPVTEVEGVGHWSPGPVAAALAAGGPSAVPKFGVRPRPAARVLLLDNYDSFVYNLAQYLGEWGAATEVVRNDAVSVDELLAQRAAGAFTHLIVSPGPGTPAEAGISVEAVRRLAPSTPILGVCLGHQAIGEAYGATVVRAPEVVHGKPSLIHHDGHGLYAGLPTPLTCARYHSLVLDETTLPPDLLVTGRTASGVVMGVRHATLPVEGVQMHPESILTTYGHEMLANFLAP